MGIKTMLLGLAGSVAIPFLIFFIVPVEWAGPLIGLILSVISTMAFGMYLISNMRMAFWKNIKQKNVNLIQRRDGFFEMVGCDYFTGWLKSKYGYHLMTDKRPEITTGKNVSISLDMFGPTIKAEDVAGVQKFAEDYKITSPGELEKALEDWRKCECGWEGIPGRETTKETVTVGGVTQELEKTTKLLCGDPKCKLHKLEKITPTVLVPFYKTVSLENVRLMMKHLMNPSKTMSLVDRLTKVKMGMETGLAQLFAKIVIYGLGGMFVLIGMGVFLNLIGFKF